MEKWYNKQFGANPHKNDKCLSATAPAPLLLKDASGYWHGQPGLVELERRVSIVARWRGNTEGAFARILYGLGFVGMRPVVQNIRAALGITQRS